VTRLALSLRGIPTRLFQSLLHTKWTREHVSWTIAYIYTLYVALSAVPPFRDTPVFSVAAASVLLVFLYIFHSYTNLDLKTASKFLVIAATISFLWEFIGVETGIPFGPYGYFCMKASNHYIMASALMVSLDTSFDPVFSAKLGLWTWTGPTQYFGVPFSNFFGWFLASLTFFALFFLASRRKPESSRYAIVFYYLFGLDNVIGDIVSGSLGLAASSFAIFTVAVAIVLLIRKNNAAKTRTKILQVEQVTSPSRQPVSSRS